MKVIEDGVGRIRAWAIIGYSGVPHLVAGWDHKKDLVELVRWVHPIKDYIIRNVAYGLRGFWVPNVEISDCEVLFVW